MLNGRKPKSTLKFLGSPPNPYWDFVIGRAKGTNMFDGEKKEYLKIVKRYNDYVALYKLFNNGSGEGVTPFEEFYWRFSYIIKYDDPAALWQSGY